jgi:hypothetical protein
MPETNQEKLQKYLQIKKELEEEIKNSENWLKEAKEENNETDIEIAQWSLERNQLLLSAVELAISDIKEKRAYTLILKSYTEVPDFEKTIEAENVIKALKEFKNLLPEWDDLVILKKIDFPINNLSEEDRIILKLLDKIKELEIEKYKAE